MREAFLITGGTGYIGSNIARRLVKDGHHVSILIRKNSSLSYLENIKDKIHLVEFNNIEELTTYIDSKEIKCIFHLASLYITEHKSEEVENLVESNVLFGAKLLEAIKNSGADMIINTTTAWQHYNNEKYNPVNLYAATKEAFECLLKFYTEKKYMRAISLEIFDTYGEDDNRGKLLNALHKAYKNNETLNMSEGTQELDLVYIEDIVNGFITAYNTLKRMEGYKKYALCSGRKISIKGLIGLYQDIKGVKLNINWGQRPNREREVMCPPYVTEKLPEWNCNVSLEDGIKLIK
ncbi:MAG: NAD-dependent epimerase/dehydratase family protein [Clostridium sp.]